jgi:general secretion pathway protein F
VRDSISEGKSLADSIAVYPDVFGRLYVNMVRAGESSGNLDLVLLRLADYIEYQVKVRGQITSAMAYPAVMMLASFGVIVFLFVKIVPQLQKLFESMKVTLPTITQIVIGLSDFLQSKWYFIGATAALGYFGFHYWYRTEKGRLKFDEKILKLPIVGPIILRMSVSGFTRTLSTLLSSGVPIISALEITKNTISNTIISGTIENAKTAVKEGESLGATIERSGIFPSLVSHMIRTGERTGELEQMLAHVSEAYEAEVERKISAMISTIEPVMIIVMGAIIVVVVVAMLLPMLSMMSQMR